MKRLFSLLTITALLFTSFACSGKKPPHEAGLKGKSVISALHDISEAYENKDLSSFMNNVAPGYRDREAFSRAVADVFSKNTTIHFNIQYTKMIIMVENKGPIKATFNWDGKWLADKGTTQKNGGRVTLVFEPDNYQVTSIDGKDPFVPLPVERQGKQ